MTEETKVIDIKQDENNEKEKIEELPYELEIEEIDEEEANIEKEELLKEMKKARIEADISEEEYEEYKKSIEERANLLDNEEAIRVANELLKQIDLPIEEKNKIRPEVIKNLKTQQALLDDYDEFQKEYQQKMEENNKEMNELFLNMKYSEIIEKLKGLIELTKSNNQNNISNYYLALLREVSNIFKLEDMKKAITKKIKKNKSGIKFISTITEDEYEKIFNKFFECLKYNKKYTFDNPILLRDELEKYLENNKDKFDTMNFNNIYINEAKDYAKYFLFGFFKFIVGNDPKKSIDKHSVFIEGIIKNIYTLNRHETEKFSDDDREKFIISIVEYVNIMI